MVELWRGLPPRAGGALAALLGSATVVAALLLAHDPGNLRLSSGIVAITLASTMLLASVLSAPDPRDDEPRGDAGGGGGGGGGGGEPPDRPLDPAGPAIDWDRFEREFQAYAARDDLVAPGG
jgi:hypothetical protein